MRRSKKYKQVVNKVDKSKIYSLKEAIKLLPELSFSKKNKGLEVHINLNLSDEKKKEGLKFSITFPNSFGKGAKVLVLTDSEQVENAKKAGADYIGLEDLVKKITEGWTDFDVVIATPSVMPKIAQLGKILGPKGMMPNPKNNTVTQNLEEAIKSYKAGRTNLKTDMGGSLHIKFAEVEMDSDKAEENLFALLKEVYNEVKNFGQNTIKSVYLAPVMGPSIRLNTEEILKSLTKK